MAQCLQAFGRSRRFFVQSLCEIFGLERVNQELKRRTRVAGLFPNEASLLRLITALLSEINDESQTAKVYLNMDNQTQPSV